MGVEECTFVPFFVVYFLKLIFFFFIIKLGESYGEMIVFIIFSAFQIEPLPMDINIY